MVELIKIISKTSDSNCYVIRDRKIALIDTGSGLSTDIVEEVSTRVDIKKIDMIINTHGHADHCGGNGHFNRFNVKCLAHEKDIAEMESGRFYGTSSMFGRDIPVRVDEVLHGGDKIDVGGTVLEVIHTPGHTPGSICLYERDARFLISGDTLFSGGNFGRTDIGGNEQQMVSSLETISNLDFDLLLPGHMNVVTNGQKFAKMAFRYAKEFFDGG